MTWGSAADEAEEHPVHLWELSDQECKMTLVNMLRALRIQYPVCKVRWAM